ncbi:ComF family protein [Persicitalea jodogahamensis]|uniref:Amidophosphoribosyltransferase n=1 Tax=Persicitalea jodogahamensis TaxID=402147 RepID=A0A8J3DDH1_9BACT|nr:ComF family protein [Persicitalea jodogahamensis]GHB85885.1 amidophosphoribosyltransferase [Persicitalea jodogahamensis]
MAFTWKTYWHDFVDLIFPRCCEACKEAMVGNEQIICTQCRATLPRVESDSVARSAVAAKFVAYKEVTGVASFLVFTKRGKVQNLLHALKYQNKPEVGVLLGKMMAQELKESDGCPAADLIVSVPLHEKRRKERGYNQSDAIAEGLSEITGIPWSGSMLARIRYTKSQTGKTKTERQENVKDIFEAVNPQQIQGKRVILVDDVLTTGATLESCLNVLLRAGCDNIHIMTIAAAQQ